MSARLRAVTSKHWQAIAKFIFTIFFSLMVTAVGACSLMLACEFLNDIYTNITGLSYLVCFVIVIAGRGLFWSISIDITDWFDKANNSSIDKS